MLAASSNYGSPSQRRFPNDAESEMLSAACRTMDAQGRKRHRQRRQGMAFHLAG
jgi:hypothetical protein